jgi:quercetin dioxygenase-like cupin family protein
MSDYEILNLREVDDMASRSGMPEGMEARFPKRELGSQQVAVSLQRLAPDLRGPFGHRHANQEELYVIVAGGGRVNLDGEVREVKAWDVIRIGPGVTRNLEAGPEGLEWLAFGGPIAEESDAEIVSGWWGDEATSV